MDLRPARPALYEAYARRGLNVKDATHQEMRSLVCAQCHVEYYFIKPNDEKNPGKANYLVFPHDKGLTCEAERNTTTRLVSTTISIRCRVPRF